METENFNKYFGDISKQFKDILSYHQNEINANEFEKLFEHMYSIGGRIFVRATEKMLQDASIIYPSELVDKYYGFAKLR